MDAQEREKAMAAIVRDIFETLGKLKTRAVPEPPENPGRFEFWTDDGRRYRVELHEVDAGPYAVIVGTDGEVRPFRPAIKTGGDVVTIGAGDVGEVRAEDLVGKTPA